MQIPFEDLLCALRRGNKSDSDAADCKFSLEEILEEPYSHLRGSEVTTEGVVIIGQLIAEVVREAV